MLPTEAEGAPRPGVQLKEAERFLDLPIDFTNVATEPVVETLVVVETTTEAAVELLPAVVPVDVPPAVATELQPPPLVQVNEDTYVPEDIEQRLIYQWLTQGPIEWRADIVVAPPPVDNAVPPGVVTINPQRFRRPRNVGFYDDGARRKILMREQTMPLTDKGAEIKKSMSDQYGAKKGEQVFYASKNAGTISGVDAKPLYGAKRGRDIYYGARDQQPMLVTAPNASVPGFATQVDDD